MNTVKYTQIRIGTSGYSYFWNEGKPTPFEWYLKQGFPTVEVNASFYRFPSKGWAKVWMKSPEYFDLSIKVHRSITHYSKLRGKAMDLWSRFKLPLADVENKISFWLFQMPSTFIYTEKNVEALLNFFGELNLGNRAVVEFRDPSWWRHIDVCEKVGVGFCSVDAPELPRDIVSINDVIYLRLHGRMTWYNYVYTDKELKSIVNTISKLEASKKYIYLNNDEGMLENGRYLMKLAKYKEKLP